MDEQMASVAGSGMKEIFGMTNTGKQLREPAEGSEDRAQERPSEWHHGQGKAFREARAGVPGRIKGPKRRRTISRRSWRARWTSSRWSEPLSVQQ